MYFCSKTLHADQNEFEKCGFQMTQWNDSANDLVITVPADALAPVVLRHQQTDYK